MQDPRDMHARAAVLERRRLFKLRKQESASAAAHSDKGGPVAWSYGVMTCPKRLDNLLPRTLASLKLAGFERPHLFVDGAHAGDYEHFGLPITARYPNVKTFANWSLSLAELYLREPKADRFALFQDDFVTYKNLRQYLESCPFPEQGYWNLYTVKENQLLADVHTTGWYASNQRGKGAVALVFNRAAVLTLLSHQHMTERPLDIGRPHVDRIKHPWWTKVDGAIVTSLRKIDAPIMEYVHNPSLVQHTGLESSMGKGDQRYKLATSFKGESFDATGLIV